MRGLLSYGLVSLNTSEFRLLRDSIDDLLAAKNDRDRVSAERSVFLCLEHGTITKAEPDTAILDEYEQLRGASAAEFYREHRDAIINAEQVRINNATKA